MTSISSVPASPWEHGSTHYFAIKDINLRERSLRQRLEAYPDSLEDEIRLYLLHRRYGTVPLPTLSLRTASGRAARPDGFMGAWLSLKLLSQAGTGLWGKKKREAEFRAHCSALCIPSFSTSPYEAESQDSPRNTCYLSLLREEWADFASLLIEICLKDRNYSSVAFGLIPVQEQALQQRIQNEINDVSSELPASYRKEAECRLFHDTMQAVYDARFPRQPL